VAFAAADALVNFEQSRILRCYAEWFLGMLRHPGLLNPSCVWLLLQRGAVATTALHVLVEDLETTLFL
jgi:hypothetical protein